MTYNFTSEDKNTLNQVFTEFYKSFWEKHNSLKTTEEQEEFYFSFSNVRRFAKENNIELPIEIEMRF